MKTLQSPYLYGIFNERSRQTRQRLTASNHVTPVVEGFDMAARAVIDPDVLRQLLDYKPSTGKLFWKERGIEFFAPVKGPEKRMKAWNARYTGREALTSSATSGHRVGSVLQVQLCAHRVAWAIYNGAWPAGVIDHINGDPSDNRILNLRDVTQRVNTRNLSLRSDNKTGISGIWDKKPKAWGSRWQVTIGQDGGIVYTKSHKCFGKAVSDRNLQYRKRGYTADHGLRLRVGAE